MKERLPILLSHAAEPGEEPDDAGKQLVNSEEMNTKAQRCSRKHNPKQRHRREKSLLETHDLTAVGVYRCV